MILVDDGSTDDTEALLERIRGSFAFTLRIHRQENKGRFLARWEGIQLARHQNVLMLDSRLLLHQDSLRYLHDSIAKDPSLQVWNGHVVTDPQAPLVGHFWSVPTYVFWGDYLADPRPTAITAENFDRVPKGTTLLYFPRELFKAACAAAWPEKNAHLTSDDTKLLRFMANDRPIRLDPAFSATYRPRTTVSQFLLHSLNRGTLFVDSYAGTSLIRNIVLILLGMVPPLALVTLLVLGVYGQWFAVAVIVTLSVIALLVPWAIALSRACPRRAGLAYLAFVVPFGVVFCAGLIRGLVIHRGSFRRSTQIKHQRDS